MILGNRNWPLSTVAKFVPLHYFGLFMLFFDQCQIITLRYYLFVNTYSSKYLILLCIRCRKAVFAKIYIIWQLKITLNKFTVFVEKLDVQNHNLGQFVNQSDLYSFFVFAVGTFEFYVEWLKIRLHRFF